MYKFFLYTVLNLVLLSNVRYNILEFIPFEVETNNCKCQLKDQNIVNLKDGCALVSNFLPFCIALSITKMIKYVNKIGSWSEDDEDAQSDEEELPIISND